MRKVHSWFPTRAQKHRLLKAWPNARNISTQHLATLLHDVATVIERAGRPSTTSCNIQNVARKIWPFSNLIQHHPTCCNTSQQGGQTYATCCAQQCCKMLRAFGQAFKLSNSSVRPARDHCTWKTIAVGGIVTNQSKLLFFLFLAETVTCLFIKSAVCCRQNLKWGNFTLIVYRI